MKTTSDSEPLTLTDLQSGKYTVVGIPALAPALECSPWTLYQAAQRGEIPTLKIGRRLVVPVPALLRMLDGESVEEPTPLTRPKR